MLRLSVLPNNEEMLFTDLSFKVWREKIRPQKTQKKKMILRGRIANRKTRTQENRTTEDQDPVLRKTGKQDPDFLFSCFSVVGQGMMVSLI